MSSSHAFGQALDRTRRESGESTGRAWSLPARVAKASPSGKELWAWASVVEADGLPVVDSQDDVIDVAELEKAADTFMTQSRDVGLMHETTGMGRVVQSLVFTRELQEALGIHLGKVGWLVKLAITDPGMQRRVASGEIRALSIGGRGQRVEI
ncbi:MAG: hypothetical protein HQL37_01595 [Alphaproteobacteria bacterium]|nr:hypothetical protein [Alphaproteobacteria bacterium]